MHTGDGPRVLITRPAEDAGSLARALARAGFDPVLVPLLMRKWDLDAVIDCAAAQPHVDWVIVTSATAADVVSTAAPHAWREARWAAVGPTTASRLEQLGYPVHCTPSQATAAQLVSALGDLTGARVLYPRADLASPKTAAALEDSGAEVVDVVAYRNVAPPRIVEDLEAALPVDATTLLSGSAATRLAAAVPTDRERLGTIACIGPSTAAVATAQRLPVHKVARPHSIAGLIAVLRTAFSPR